MKTTLISAATAVVIVGAVVAGTVMQRPPPSRQHAIQPESCNIRLSDGGVKLATHATTLEECFAAAKPQ